MTQKQPSPQHVVEYQHSVMIDGHPFEYAVRATVYGEVLSTENLLAQLPEAALKLTYGKDSLQTFAKAGKYQKLFRYRLPLVFSGILKDSDCNGIMAAIAERRKELYLRECSIETEEIGDEWTRDLYHIVTDRSLPTNLDIVESLQFMAILVHGSEYGQAFSILGNSRFSLAAPIIYELLTDKSLKIRDAINAYEVLQYFPSDTNRDLLHEHLFLGGKEVLRSGIIKGLLPYKDEKTWSLLSRLYEEEFNILTDSAVEALLMCFGNFKKPEAEEILWDFVLDPDKEPGYVAFRILRDIFTTEEEIAGRIRPLVENSFYLKGNKYRSL